MLNHFTSLRLALLCAKEVVKTFTLPSLVLLLLTACSNVTMIESAIERRSHDPLVDSDVLHPGVGSKGSLHQISPRAAELFHRAIRALEDKQYALAEPTLNELVVQLPDFSSLHTNLGIVYAHTSRPEMALVSLHRAVELKPDDCAPRVQIGLLQRQGRAFSAAEKSYLACIVSDPDYAPAYLNLGILYELYLGRLPEALSAYERYQTLSPSKLVATWVMDLSRRVEAGKQLATRGELR